MNTTIHQHRWQPYENLATFSLVLKKAGEALKLINSTPIFFIPSIELGTDGPILTSVFITTKTHICELRMNQNIADFDISLINTITNFRVTLGSEVIIKQPPQIIPPSEPGDNLPLTSAIKFNISFSTAKISLLHDFGPGSKTVITFAGTDYTDWLNLSYEAFPISLLLNRATKAS